MKKRIRIAFDATPLLANKTGVAYYIERLCTSLAEQYPNDIELVGFYYNFLRKKHHVDLPTRSNLRYCGTLPIIPSKVIFALRRIGIQTPIEFLLRQRVDFILYPNFLGYPSLRHTPSAPVIHDLSYIDLPDYVSARNRKDLVRFMPIEIKRSSFLVTVSRFSEQRIKEVYKTTKDVLVTPIPPDSAEIKDSGTIARSLERLGITKPFVLFLGTVEPRKNIVSLINAYLGMSQALQDEYTLVIAGRIGWNCTDEVDTLASVKEEGKNILHLGYVSDEDRKILYQSATLFVTASHYEGFGMPILEAMSYGTACAISDIPVFHEVAGPAAIYFDQSKTASIGNALSNILANKKQLALLSKQGKQRVDTMTWSSVAQSLHDEIIKRVS